MVFILIDARFEFEQKFFCWGSLSGGIVAERAIGANNSMAWYQDGSAVFGHNGPGGAGGGGISCSSGQFPVGNCLAGFGSEAGKQDISGELTGPAYIDLTVEIDRQAAKIIC